MATRPEASRATKFTYLLSCSANELVHRRLGVSVHRSIDVSVYSLHRCIDVSMYRCIGESLKHRCIDVLEHRYRSIDVSVYRCSDDAHWFIGSSVLW